MVRQYEEKIEIITLPGQDSTAAMKKFVEDKGLESLIHLPDTGGDVWRHFGVGFRGTWVYIDDDGSVSVEPGHLNKEKIQERFDRLIAQ